MIAIRIGALKRAMIDFARKDPDRFVKHAPGLAGYVNATQDDYRITFDILENQKRSPL